MGIGVGKKAKPGPGNTARNGWRDGGVPRYDGAMATDPRSALDRLIGALETFHQAATTAGDPDADSVIEASDALADAYTIYDDVIFTEFGVESPLDIYADDDDEDDADEYEYYDGDDELDDDVDFDEDDVDDE